MQILKNLIVGFAISFIGSIPLGYLNIIGFTIYKQEGLPSLIYFLLGIITVEVFVIYFALIFAEKISANKKLLKIIEQFSILFLFILVGTVTIQTLSITDSESNLTYINSNYYLNGILLNCLNLMQIPFWAGWSIYLMSSNMINIKRYNKVFYLSGTLAGTFAGMITFIITIKKLSESIHAFKDTVNYLLLLTFTILLFIQIIKYYKKHLIRYK